MIFLYISVLLLLFRENYIMSMSKVLKDVKNLIFEETPHGYGGINTIGKTTMCLFLYFTLLSNNLQ